MVERTPGNAVLEYNSENVDNYYSLNGKKLKLCSIINER